jgi:DNA-nicking Smr family endonuclease
VTMKDEESIYQVFQGLSGLVESRRICLAGKEPPAPQNPIPEKAEPDESEAFLEAMEGVTRIHGKNMRVPEVAGNRGSVLCRKQAEPSMEEVLGNDSAFNVVNLPEFMEGYADDLSPLIMEKLRNGEFSVQKVLDLHGLSALNAAEAFRDFIREAVHSQMYCVRIIHGRGLKSKQGPVLKEKLKEWIVQAMHRRWIVAFSSSKMREGGPGATTILLRTRAHKKRLHIIG